MILQFLKLPDTALNIGRVACFNFKGINLPFSTRIGRGCELDGRIMIDAKVSIGKDVRIKGNVKIGSGCDIGQGVEIVGNVDIGNHTSIGSYSILSTMPDGCLKIGDDVQVNSFSVLGASERVEIKDHCIFAAYIQITDAAHGFDDPSVLIKHAPFTTAPVVIEENVWLGSGVMIMKGVTIGKGAVIGAKSLVTRDVSPFSIAYGIPARIARTRERHNN